MLEDMGATVTRFPQTDRGDHVRAEFAGGPRQVLLLGHFDTVWNVGQLDRMPIREEGGRLYGPGVYDIHSPRVPDKTEMLRLLDKALQVIGPEQLWVNPDCGLKTRNWPETEAALGHMVDAARELRIRYRRAEVAPAA